MICFASFFGHDAGTDSTSDPLLVTCPDCLRLLSQQVAALLDPSQVIHMLLPPYHTSCGVSVLGSPGSASRNFDEVTCDRCAYKAPRCPSCGSRRITYKSEDNWFTERAGCLDCNKWCETAVLKVHRI